MRITDSIFTAFLECRYKAALMIGEGGSEGDGPVRLTAGDLVCRVDGVEQRGGSDLPVVFSASEVPSDRDKMKLAFAAHLLGKISGVVPKRGIVVSKSEGKRTRVSLSAFGARVQKTLREITVLAKEEREKYFFLNKHCAVCVYTVRCREKAVREDHLSLIQGMNAREIRKKNSQGIFTVTQLSYTFKPRRSRPDMPVKNNPALRALALREKKTYVVHRPRLPFHRTELFLDIEGVPDRDFFI